MGRGGFHPSPTNIMSSQTERLNMSEILALEPIELTNAELDLVTGAASAVAGFGLANVALGVDNIDVLRNANILNNNNILDNNTVTLKDIANANHVGVGAVIQALGGVAAIVQHL